MSEVTTGNVGAGVIVLGAAVYAGGALAARAGVYCAKQLQKKLDDACDRQRNLVRAGHEAVRNRVAQVMSADILSQVRKALDSVANVIRPEDVVRAPGAAAKNSRAQTADLTKNVAAQEGIKALREGIEKLRKQLQDTRTAAVSLAGVPERMRTDLIEDIKSRLGRIDTLAGEVKGMKPNIGEIQAALNEVATGFQSWKSAVDGFGELAAEFSGLEERVKYLNPKESSVEFTEEEKRELKEPTAEEQGVLDELGAAQERFLDVREAYHTATSLSDAEQALRKFRNDFDKIEETYFELYESSQRDATLSASRGALGACGFGQIDERPDGSGGSVLTATRGDKAMEVKLDDSMKLSARAIGFKGTECQGEVTRFLKELQKRGVLVQQGEDPDAPLAEAKYSYSEVVEELKQIMRRWGAVEVCETPGRGIRLTAFGKTADQDQVVEFEEDGQEGWGVFLPWFNDKETPLSDVRKKLQDSPADGEKRKGEEPTLTETTPTEEREQDLL